MQTVFGVKTIGIAGTELINVHLEDRLQIIADSFCADGQISCDIAKFFCHVFAIESVALVKMLFENINAFSGFAVQTHQAIENTRVFLRHSGCGPKCLFLVLIRRHNVHTPEKI
jgi:hypothetical protein